jgi:hypothetical protein
VAGRSKANRKIDLNRSKKVENSPGIDSDNPGVRDKLLRLLWIPVLHRARAHLRGATAVPAATADAVANLNVSRDRIQQAPEFDRNQPLARAAAEPTITPTF